MPNVRYVGGLAVSENKTLPIEFQSFMDKSTSGVVIVSFESIAKKLPKHRMECLIRSLKLLKNVSVVIKYFDNIHGVSVDKFMVSTWIPQNDLLAYPNTKLFVTHCGNGGQYEALYHGVPMLGLPLFGDQHGNCKLMASRGFGECLNFCDFTEKDFEQLVHTILTNKEYEKRIGHGSDTFRSLPRLPSEDAAFWIDHVIKYRYGSQYYDNPSKEMSYFKLYSIDVLFVVTMFSSFIVCISGFCCRCIYKTICRSKLKQTMHWK